ncbi:MAG: tetratricopeptide repeat protein [Candidatus Cloacimonetes bacterium]|nr:tetratricopeptide repeat protein [Candidatus Cloacimonadota bacterium]
MNFFLRNLTANFLVRIAQIFERLGRNNSAAGCYQRSLRIYSTPEASWKLSLLLIEKRQYKQAETLLREVVATYPERMSPNASLAFCLLMQRHWSKAETLYQQLFEASPSKFQKFARLSSNAVERDKFVLTTDMQLAARELIDEKRYSDALTQLREAYEFAPGNAEIANNIGWLMLKTGSPTQDALPYFEQAVKNAPDDSRFLKHYHRTKKRT